MLSLLCRFIDSLKKKSLIILIIEILKNIGIYQIYLFLNELPGLCHLKYYRTPVALHIFISSFRIF